MGVVYVFALLMFTRSVDNVPQANMLQPCMHTSNYFYAFAFASDIRKQSLTLIHFCETHFSLTLCCHSYKLSWDKKRRFHFTHNSETRPSFPTLIECSQCENGKPKVERFLMTVQRYFFKEKKIYFISFSLFHLCCYCWWKCVLKN